ncbi:hypothetical protein LAh9_37 [Aeromonas phage LAh_9]|uniref:Uncharacterized protein n=1 Tax=Aeromonas phage LAh_9 TaxID=2591033 RepID=A0A514A144_9CAUD|nr:hypothetical protein HWC32_gp037 [Aeromonas phage LAh_9]QDH46955.1 hypothetical protein LAh9_37 [Aeromonas phage LAh_9]
MTPLMERQAEKAKKLEEVDEYPDRQPYHIEHSLLVKWILFSASWWVVANHEQCEPFVVVLSAVTAFLLTLQGGMYFFIIILLGASDKTPRL